MLAAITAVPKFCDAWPDSSASLLSLRMLNSFGGWVVLLGTMLEIRLVFELSFRIGCFFCFFLATCACCI